MFNKIGLGLFVIGIIMIIVGLPYLLGYTTNEILKYPLYLGLIVTVLFMPRVNRKEGEEYK